jgi:hypothetical protein
MGWSRQERIEIQDKYEALLPEVQEELMRRHPEIICVSLGLKLVNGQPTQEFAWLVYVQTKKAPSDLQSGEMIPKEFAGLRTDVMEYGEIREAEDTASYRPMWGGSQIQPPATVTVSTAGTTTTEHHGTLGCFVLRGGKVHLLSNHHVIGDVVNTLVGQSVAPTSDSCCCDGGGIAKVVQGIVGTVGGPNNQVDAAVAILFGQTAGDGKTIHYTNNILQIGPVFGSTTNLVAGDIVRKRGRTTELTTGTVITKTLTVNNGTAPNTVTYTNNQIQIQAIAPQPNFARGGDSGSVVVNNRNQVIGLLAWAGVVPGSNPVQYTDMGFANRIEHVETRLNCTVISSALAGHPETLPMSGYEVAEPLVYTATPATFIKKIEEQLKHSEEGQQLMQVAREHRSEVLDLINDNREVKIAWNRYQGPSFVGHLIKNINEPQHPLPSQIEGYSLQNLLIKMSDVLERHGSRKLAQAVEDYFPVAFDFSSQYRGFDSLDTLLRKAHICPNCGQPQNLNLHAE